MNSADRNTIIAQLKKELLLQGNKTPADGLRPDPGLGAINRSFAGNTFPTGTIHELISHEPENAAATNGFLAGLIGRLTAPAGTCLWVSTRRTIFPLTLKAFGVSPERVIFIDIAREKEALWVIEEALKCEALTVVVGELQELSFTHSRRLQLAVEHSHVTGFIHRYRPRTENIVACTTRWKICPLASMPDDGLPGVGFPRWQVQLLKSRNGTTGTWELEWRECRFVPITAPAIAISAASSVKQAG